MSCVPYGLRGALCLLLLVPGSASAGLIMSLHNAGGSGHAISLDPSLPGDMTFSMDVWMHASPEAIFSAEAYLVTNLPSAITITAYAYNAAVWETITTGSGGAVNPINPKGTLSPPYYLPIPSAVTTASHGRLGSITNNLLTGMTGSALLVSLNLSVTDTTAPGTYMLNVQGVVGGDVVTYNNFEGTGGADFSLTVLPEPATLLLLAIGAACLRRRS